jgi:hypothetical protein
MPGRKVELGSPTWLWSCIFINKNAALKDLESNKLTSSVSDKWLQSHRTLPEEVRNMINKIRGLLEKLSQQFRQKNVALLVNPVSGPEKKAKALYNEALQLRNKIPKEYILRAPKLPKLLKRNIRVRIQKATPQATVAAPVGPIPAGLPAFDLNSMFQMMMMRQMMAMMPPSVATPQVVAAEPAPPNHFEQVRTRKPYVKKNKAPVKKTGGS